MRPCKTTNCFLPPFRLALDVEIRGLRELAQLCNRDQKLGDVEIEIGNGVVAAESCVVRVEEGQQVSLRPTQSQPLRRKLMPTTPRQIQMHDAATNAARQERNVVSVCYIPFPNVSQRRA